MCAVVVNNVLNVPLRSSYVAVKLLKHTCCFLCTYPPSCRDGSPSVYDYFFWMYITYVTAQVGAGVVLVCILKVYVLGFRVLGLGFSRNAQLHIGMQMLSQIFLFITELDS